MKTLILPGYSIKNKIWAEEIKNKLGPTLNTDVIYWKHWNNEGVSTVWIDEAVTNINKNYENCQSNIIAKSIGTLVAMKILTLNTRIVNKVILCGIPLNDLTIEDKRHYSILSNFPNDKILCVQNENDNHGNFSDVQKFIRSLNPATKIISQPRNDHEYPYPRIFIEFLKE